MRAALKSAYSAVGYVFPYSFNVQIEIKVDSRSVFHEEFKNGRWQIF